MFHGLAQEQSQKGAWGALIPLDLIPVSVANLPDGRLMTWSSKYRLSFGSGDGFTYTQIFDPFASSGNQVLPRSVSETNHEMFCPGINNLPDGRILVAGGSTSERTTIYDPTTGVWSRADDMNLPRGYQGNVTLLDGSVFTLGGSWSGGRGGKSAELYSPESGWVSIPSIQGELLLEGNDSNIDERQQGIYRSDNHAWLWAAPNGKIFHAGPGTDMHWIDVRDLNNPTVQNLGDRAGDTYSMNGTTAMFDIGKLLKVGGSRTYSGGTPASDKTFIIDINSEAPNVTPVNGFKRARAMHNSTVLPDGKVLITGGLKTAKVFTDVGAEYVGEIYDPSTNTWVDTAPMQVPRTYHSVAILMADARVFVGGGGLCGNCGDKNHLDAEIYSPPYLFSNDGSLAARPTVSAPELADYNSIISVSGSESINSFNLIRLSSATHSVNNEQRRIPLSFTSAGTAYDLEIPDRALLPPGYYMLFALDGAGVPSIAEILKIGKPLPLGGSPNLVLDLSFDEGNGAIAADGSQYGNDAVFVERDNAKNEVPLLQNYWTTNGLFGNAMEMDGKEFESNSIVEVPYSESMATIADGMTVMAWVYRDEIEKNVAILAHDYPRLFFGFHNSLYKLQFPTSQGGSVDCYSGYSPPQKWVHIAGTFDGNVGKLYANGVEICSDVALGEITLQTTGEFMSSFTTSGFYDRRQAQSLSGITDELDGRIDELKVFNTALGGQEIRTFYNLGIAQDNPSVVECAENTIVAQYKIGDGSWQTGGTVFAAVGEEVYLRASVAGEEEYFVTLPYSQQNTFSSLDDFSNFEDTTAYKVDTFISSGDGLIDSRNAGQYVLTTVNGCAVSIALEVIGDCDSIEQEYRINGVWQSGEEEIIVDEGDEIVLSILPNGVGLITTLPDGRKVGDNYNLGPITKNQEGGYILSAENGCIKQLKIIVNTSETKETFCTSIQTGFDDAEEFGQTGAVYLDSSDLELVSDEDFIGGVQTIGLRFNTTNVPQGVTIESAYLQFTVDEVSKGASDMTIYGEMIDDAQPFTEARFDISGRQSTVANVKWTPGDWNSVGASGDRQRSPNLAAIVQEVVNRAGFKASNAIAFFVKGMGTRTAESYDGLPEGAPELCITYSSKANCPEGSVIPEYRINGVWDSGKEEITVEEGDDLMLSILPNGVGVTITLPDGTRVGDDYSLGAVTPLANGVYTMTNESGCSNTLTITVNPKVSDATTICVTIDSDFNDVEEYNLDGSMYLDSSDLELGADEDFIGGLQTVGLRFNNMNIPVGATIENATLQFTVDEVSRGVATFEIIGEFVNNSRPFEYRPYNVSDRSTTNSTVNWSPANWDKVGASGNAQKTPDLAPILQEIIDRKGFRTNNSITILISGNGTRTAFSHDSDSEKAPKLCIAFSVSSSSEVKTVLNSQESTDTDNDILIFPNPTSGIIQLDLTAYMKVPLGCSVFNASQQLVFEKVFEADHNFKEELDFSGMAEGVYYIVFTYSKGTLAKSFIIDK